MANELFGFEWRVAAGGYRWEKFETAGDPMSGTGPKTSHWVIAPSSGPSRTYRPLREFTGLYRQFAETTPEKPSILDFADRFGLLGTDVTRHPDPASIRDDQTVGEALEDWITHIRVMADAVDVWDRLARGDAAGLTEMQRSNQLFTQMSPHREREPVLAGMLRSPYETYEYFHRPEALAPLPAVDETSPAPILRAGRAFVMDEVNEHLMETRVAPGLILDESAAPRFYVVPQTLLGAMWLQFAEAISQQKEYRRCDACARPFEIATGRARGSRRDARFCTSACRTEFHNQRRRDARKMREDGKTLREIAAQLDITPEALQKLRLPALKARRRPARKKR